MLTCVSFSLPISASYLSSPSRGWTRHRRCSASGGTTTATISSPSLTTSSRSVLWLNTVFCYHHFVGTVGSALVFLHTLVFQYPSSIQTEAFCDVTIACDGASVKCHKMILSACSSYFQQLFMENTCDHPIVFLKVCCAVVIGESILR